MLYGHKEMVNSRITTLVSSADTIEEYMAFLDLARKQSIATRKFNEMFTSQVLQHLTEELYQGFKKPIHAFFHDTEEQRDEFVKEWNIKILLNGVNARDKQEDMVFEQKTRTAAEQKRARNAAEEAAEAAGVEYTGEKEKTLGELNNLTQEDPWDRRSDAEVEYDDEMRRMMKAAKEAGTMSDDSFAPSANDANPDKMKTPPSSSGTATADEAGDGKLKIVDTDGLIRADGTLDISKIQAVKKGGPVDENLKAAREEAHEKLKEEKLAGRKTFSPEDFAAVLAGDRSSDANNIRGDKDIRTGAKPVDRPVLSPDATAAREEVASAEENAIKQTRAENDFKHKQERDQGVFRGAALDGEDEVDVEDLPEDLRKELESIGYKGEEILTKDYPFNSQLGHKSVIPFDGYGPLPSAGQKDFPQISNIISTVNVEVEGTISIGDANAAIVRRKDEALDGWVIIQRTGGRLGTNIAVSVIKIR